MSGLEVVGVVLGAFPLVFLAVDGYRKAAEKVNMIQYYEKHLDNFQRDMNTIHQRFRYNLEYLLAPMTDPNELEMLLANPKDIDWSTLADGVRRRLPGFYEAYISTTEEILLEMKSLEKHLENSKPNETYHSSSSKVSSVCRHPFYRCFSLMDSYRSQKTPKV